MLEGLTYEQALWLIEFVYGKRAREIIERGMPWKPGAVRAQLKLLRPTLAGDRRRIQ